MFDEAGMGELIPKVSKVQILMLYLSNKPEPKA